MSTAQENQGQIAQFDARDEVTDAMAELVVRYVTDSGLLAVSDLRMALEVAIDLAGELAPELAATAGTDPR